MEGASASFSIPKFYNMENQKKEYSEDDSFDVDKTAAEYGNVPHRMKSDMTGNTSFEETTEPVKNNETTGSGLSVAERDTQDGTNSDLVHDKKELVEKYNIDDNAHRDSSAEDFIPTVSNFHHADSDKAAEDASRDYLAK